MRDNLATIKDVARLYDIRSILGLNENKRVIVCPLPHHKHQNHTPSFSIFTANGKVQKWVCHGSCGLYGDVVDLVGFLNVPGYRKNDKETVKQAIAILTGRNMINPPKPEPVKQARLPNSLYRKYLPAGDEVRAYAHYRFLTPETLKRFYFGQHKTGNIIWMTMPTIHGEQLRGIKLRNTRATGKKDRFSQIGGSIDGLFNYNEVRDTKESVLIVKAEITTAILSQFGILACAPTGGETSYYKHEELLIPLAFARKRMVVPDNDPRQDVREKIMAAAQRRSEIFKASLQTIPEQFVGIDDWVLAEPDIAVPQIKDWMR